MLRLLPAGRPLLRFPLNAPSNMRAGPLNFSEVMLTPVVLLQTPLPPRVSPAAVPAWVALAKFRKTAPRFVAGF